MVRHRDEPGLTREKADKKGFESAESVLATGRVGAVFSGWESKY